MDPTQKECRKCQLYNHRTENALPPGAELAWLIFQRLTSPAIERFGLQGEVWRSLNLGLKDRQVDELIADLDEILAGYEEAREQLKPPKPKKG